MTQIMAIIYTVLASGVVAFQFCLVLGLPWGSASMGGRFPGKYPVKMRYVAAINMFVLIVLAIIVLVHADLAFATLQRASRIAIWFVVAFAALSVVLNTITPSRIERNIWAPVTAIQLICCVIVALT